MPSTTKTPRRIGLVGLALIGLAALPCRAQTQAHGAGDDWAGKLAVAGTASDLDVAALRQQAADRIKARAKIDAAPLKRPLVAPELLKLPQVSVDIQFDEDASVVRPESYRTLGLIADVFSTPALMGYRFLIVAHTISTGKRENNLLLSQRRADVIRDILISTFKISPKRLQALGLGEEQMRDSAHPTAPINQQVQIVSVGSLPEVSSSPTPAVVPAKAGTHKPRPKPRH